MVNPFDVFSVTEDEALKALEEIKSNPRDRDAGVCICGHPRSKHIESHLGHTCSPGKLFCPCKKLRVVLETPNLRFFMAKTRGGGSLHALLQGITATTKAGLETNWVGETVCDRCGKDGRVNPVPVSQRGVEMDEATGYDALLCDGCRFGSEGSDGR